MARSSLLWLHNLARHQDIMQLVDCRWSNRFLYLCIANDQGLEVTQRNIESRRHKDGKKVASIYTVELPTRVEEKTTYKELSISQARRGKHLQEAKGGRSILCLTERMQYVKHSCRSPLER